LLSKEKLKRIAVLEAAPAAETCRLDLTKVRRRIETEMAKWRQCVTTLSADVNIYYDSRNLSTEMSWQDILCLFTEHCDVEMHLGCGRVKDCSLGAETLADLLKLGSNHRETGNIVIW